MSGLVAATELARAGREVLVFERHPYPRHKVCGEYLSAEVVPYLGSLGVNLEDACRISRLKLQSLSGPAVTTTLPLGGLGISRFALDDRLYNVARNSGVRFRFETVREIHPTGKEFMLRTDSGAVRAGLALAAWGKRSVLDRQTRRSFFDIRSGWLAVKNHFPAEYPDDMVGLYTFPGGYGGLSCTETGAVNFCYLIRKDRFRDWGGPEGCTRTLTERHPGIREVLSGISPLLEQPLVISQVSFEKKSRRQGQLLFAGDAARLIHPLTGNGMAMAITGGRMLAQHLLERGTKTNTNPRKSYEAAWSREFGARLQFGLVLQWILTRSGLTDFMVRVAARFPRLLPPVVAGTHGNGDRS